MSLNKFLLDALLAQQSETHKEPSHFGKGGLLSFHQAPSNKQNSSGVPHAKPEEGHLTANFPHFLTLLES